MGSPRGILRFNGHIELEETSDAFLRVPVQRRGARPHLSLCGFGSREEDPTIGVNIAGEFRIDGDTSREPLIIRGVCGVGCLRARVMS